MDILAYKLIQKRRMLRKSKLMGGYDIKKGIDSVGSGIRNWFNDIKDLSVSDSQGTYKLTSKGVTYETLPSIPTESEIKAQQKQIEAENQKKDLKKYLPFAIPVGLFVLKRFL